MKRILRIVSLVFILLIVVAMLFLLGSSIKSAKKVSIKNTELQMITAVRSFYMEYDYYPAASHKAIVVNQELIDILRGEEAVFNWRKLVFIQIPNATINKDGRWVGGFSPEMGILVDHYGNPFLVKFDTDYNGLIDNPYTDVEAGNRKLQTPVIVWSPGKDGIFGDPKAPGQFQGSDDIISWQ